MTAQRVIAVGASWPMLHGVSCRVCFIRTSMGYQAVGIASSVGDKSPCCFPNHRGRCQLEHETQPHSSSGTGMLSIAVSIPSDCVRWVFSAEHLSPKNSASRRRCSRHWCSHVCVLCFVFCVWCLCLCCCDGPRTSLDGLGSISYSMLAGLYVRLSLVSLDSQLSLEGLDIHQEDLDLMLWSPIPVSVLLC